MATGGSTSARNEVAIVDRVTFNAHILETGTKSYRLGTSKPPPEPNGPTKLGGAKILLRWGLFYLDTVTFGECAQRSERPGIFAVLVLMGRCKSR